MSSDDRERMMKSRALPEEFPILQTLHTYGARMVSTPVASPTDYSSSTAGGIGYQRTEAFRRRSHLGNDDDVAVSPTTSYGLSFTPNTQSSSDMLSPVSTSGERSGYLGYMAAPLGQQRGNPFSRAADPYRAHHGVPRLQLHDTPRSLGENPGPPLTTSTTYGGHDEYQHGPGGYSLQGMYNNNNEPPRSVPPDTPASPYVHSNPGTWLPSLALGGAFACDGTVLTIATGGFAHPYPSPAPASNHGRPSFPPPLTLSEFKYSQPPLTPHSGTMSGFATAPLAPSQEYQIPQMSAPADATSFGSSYLTRGAGGSLGSATAPNAPGSAQQEGDRTRLSVGGREFGHQRKRSSSHPPSFIGGRDP